MRPVHEALIMSCRHLGSVNTAFKWRFPSLAHSGSFINKPWKSARRCLWQTSAPASYYRGGTSRGLIFDRSVLPANISEWPAIFRAVLGSPDPNGRQLDGIGGGVSSLSKICVVSKSQRENADVDFHFAAVGIKDKEVDMSGNCGNLTAAIGPYAIDNGVVYLEELSVNEGQIPKDATAEITEKFVTVRIYNTNTDKLINSTFPVLVSPSDGHVEAQSHGDFAIDGVATTAARISLDFVKPAGSKTGRLLPTGNIIDTFHGKQATCIDVANPAIFVRAKDFGVSGSITPDEATNHPTLLADLDKVRRTAAVKMGVGTCEAKVPGSIPKICLVSPAASCTLPSGVEQNLEEIDILIRAISVGQPHRAIPITTALAVAAAAKLKGSIVNENISETEADDEGITIGHASGKLVVSSSFDEDGYLTAATVYRTARRLLEGRIYWRRE